MTSELENLLWVSEPARRLELSAQRLRALPNEGQIACVVSRLGRLFDPADIERFRLTRGCFGRYEATGDRSAPSQ